MARFYFDLYDGGVVYSDEEGLDYPHAMAARDFAIKSARGLMAGDINNGPLCLSCHIEVRDDQGVVVTTVNFSDTVEVSGLTRTGRRRVPLAR
jgi:hypothetical protein